MTRPNNTIRVFIALDIPADAKQQLAGAINQLSKTIRGGVRWVDPEGIHLTLKFLGNIDPALVDDIKDAMSGAAQGTDYFSLRLSALGIFPNPKQPRVLWAGVDGDLESLNMLQEKVDSAISTLGFDRETRAFSPHLTLGRVRDGVAPNIRRQIGETISNTSLEPGNSWTVTDLHLIRTNLSPQGTTYTSLASKPLRGHDG